MKFPSSSNAPHLLPCFSGTAPFLSPQPFEHYKRRHHYRPSSQTPKCHSWPEFGQDDFNNSNSYSTDGAADEVVHCSCGRGSARIEVDHKGGIGIEDRGCGICNLYESQQDFCEVLRCWLNLLKNCSIKGMAREVESEKPYAAVVAQKMRTCHQRLRSRARSMGKSRRAPRADLISNFWSTGNFLC